MLILIIMNCFNKDWILVLINKFNEIIININNHNKQLI